MEHVEYRIKNIEVDLVKARKRLVFIDRLFGCAIGAAVVYVGIILPLIVK